MPGSCENIKTGCQGCFGTVTAAYKKLQKYTLVKAAVTVVGAGVGLVAVVESIKAIAPQLLPHIPCYASFLPTYICVPVEVYGGTVIILFVISSLLCVKNGSKNQ